MLDEFRPVPKPSNNRRVKKRKERTNFSSKTVQEIFERDDWACVRCGSQKNLESIPHHVTFRSQLGDGGKQNGVVICRRCHDFAHRYKDIRRYFEVWVELNLDTEGNLKHKYPKTPNTTDIR